MIKVGFFYLLFGQEKVNFYLHFSTGEVYNLKIKIKNYI
jgi:hypothetical protein